MKILALALASSVLVTAPALAKSPFSSPPGKDPRVCLLTFSSAAAADAGADAEVVKAQYLPLQIALKLAGDATVTGIGWYGAGELTADQEAKITDSDLHFFNYPDATVDTQDQCELYMQIAADNQADDDEEDSET